MSNVYGAGAPAAGLNAPGGAPPWLMNLWNYVNPMAQATAGAVDDQGRPQTPIAGAQQALAANAAPSALSDSLAARSAPLPMTASMVARGPGGGSAGGGGATGAYPMDPGIRAQMMRPPPLPLTGEPGIGSGHPIPPGPLPALINPWETGRSASPAITPPSKPAVAVNPRARQQAQVAAAAPQVPWITTAWDRPNLPAGNGPLGRNAQRTMGMPDFSRLFNRGG